MVRHGGSSASLYLAGLTSPIPSHCAVIILFKSVPAHQLLTSTLREYIQWPRVKVWESLDMYNYSNCKRCDFSENWLKVANLADFPKSVCLSVLTGTFGKQLNGHQICSVQKTDQYFNEMEMCWGHITGHFNKTKDSYKIHNFYSCI